MADAARERILVWGAGAIGGTVAAYLARAGHTVTAVDAAVDHVAAIRANALQIEGPVAEFRQQMDARSPDDVEGRWSIVLLAVKAQHTLDAAQHILPHLTDDGMVVSFQNGLCEDGIASVVGAERTIGCFVNFAGDWLAPGLIRYGQRGALVLGELDGRMTPRLARLGALLRDFDPQVQTSPEIWSYLWGKLSFAAFLYATALGQSPMVTLLERDDLVPVWRAVCGEVYDVAHAEGVVPRAFDGFRPEAFARTAPLAATRTSIAAMLEIMRPSAKTHSGYWRDIAIRKRRTEVDMQLLPILDRGARRGLRCPALSELVDRIHALESGATTQSDRLFEEFRDSILLLSARPA